MPRGVKLGPSERKSLSKLLRLVMQTGGDPVSRYKARYVLNLAKRDSDLAREYGKIPDSPRLNALRTQTGKEVAVIPLNAKASYQSSPQQDTEILQRLLGNSQATKRLARIARSKELADQMIKQQFRAAMDPNVSSKHTNAVDELANMLAIVHIDKAHKRPGPSPAFMERMMELTGHLEDNYLNPNENKFNKLTSLGRREEYTPKIRQNVDHVNTNHLDVEELVHSANSFIRRIMGAGPQ